RRRHTRFSRDWSSDVCSSDLGESGEATVCAVVDEKQYRTILNYIEIGKQEGRLVLGGEPAEGPGYYIQPTIFADVPADARIACEIGRASCRERVESRGGGGVG